MLEVKKEKIILKRSIVNEAVIEMNGFDDEIAN